MRTHLYSTDYASIACLGEMIKINGLEDDKRRTFFPAIVSAVKTTTDSDGDILSAEAVSCEDAMKALREVVYSCRTARWGNERESHGTVQQWVINEIQL